MTAGHAIVFVKAPRQPRVRLPGVFAPPKTPIPRKPLVKNSCQKKARIFDPLGGSKPEAIVTPRACCSTLLAEQALA